MVAPQFRGSGFGRLLLEAAGEWARGAGAVYVALATRRAGEFYRALGFEDSAVYFKKVLLRVAGVTSRRQPGQGKEHRRRAHLDG